jgi:DNA-binding CsgD family transcriptional regulator
MGRVGALGFSLIAAQDTSANRNSSGCKTDFQSLPRSTTVTYKAALQTSCALWPELSARERQMVQLILEGFPAASIAKKLGIAYGTVKNHRLNIYRKLDITTERELFLNYITLQPEARFS